MLGSRVLPLALRLPNRPPLLVGRAPEVERMAAAIRRSPLTIVYGPRGLGATAVVLDVLHREFADHVDQIRYLEPGADVKADVVRALGGATASAEAALDLAEAAGAWLVLDGVRDPGWRLAALVARYARASKWIAISTELPSDAVLEHAIPISALDPMALAELAASWQPGLGPGDVEVAVTAARGSPRRLRRILADRIGSANAHAPRGSIAERVLAVLAVTELPLPRELVLDVVRGVTDADLEELDERGLVVASDAGLAIPAQIKPAAPVEPSDMSIGVELAERLGRSLDPVAIAEAIRLALSANALALAHALLERDGARLIAEGHAPRFAHVLLATHDPALTSWRLRVGVEIGDGAVLADLADDSAHSPSRTDRLLWAEALMRANKIDAALEVVSTIEDPAARLLAARGFGTRGELAAARGELERLAGMADVPRVIAVRAATLAARLEALAGRAPAARAKVAELRPQLGGLPPTAVAEVIQSIASTYHDVGDLDAAEAALDELERRLDFDELARFVGRRARLVRASVWLDRGRLDDAAHAFDEIERASSFASLHRPFLVVLRAQLALARDDLHAAARGLGEVRDLDVGTGYLGAWATSLAARLALIEPALAPMRPAPAGTGLWPMVARLDDARSALRAGRSGSPRELATDADSFELYFATRALEWERALVGGEAAAALALATDTAARCAHAGFGIHEADALAGAIDAAIVAGDIAARDAALDRLDALAARLGLPRQAAEIELVRELLGARRPVQLERIAMTSGPRSRRARFALGDTAIADQIDRAVCIALDVVPAAVVAGLTASWPGWGVDRTSKCVWLPDGRIVELADKPQMWKLLDTLVTTPTFAAKETLVESAWGIAYHPLRHDKLLHNAIHKLRKLIEEPGAPRRIATVLDGYRLGESEPLRLIG